MTTVELRNEIDLYTQSVKIVGSYYKLRYICRYNRNLDYSSSEEFYSNFVDNALFVLYTRCRIQYTYDNSRGNLTTFIFSCLDREKMTIVFMTMFNLNYNEAKNWTARCQKLNGLDENNERFSELANLIVPFSYDIPVYSDDRDSDESVKDTIEDVDINIEDSLVYKEQLKEILTYIQNMRAKKSKNIFLYYITEGNFKYTETASHLKISRQRVEQVIKKIRSEIIKKFGKDYLTK